MGERLSPQAEPYIVGKTEILKGRRTHFELQLINSSGQIIDNSTRLEGLEELETWEVDKNKIFFYSPFSMGVLVCDVKKSKQTSIRVGNKSEKFTAYTVGTHADSWFNTLLNTPDLRVVARIVPNSK